jgi:hypothetical protein
VNSGFMRRDGSVYRAFSADEIRVLRGLADGLDQTIGENESDDPVLQRLAPSAYGDDVESSEEFAGFTRERILDAKRERLAFMVASLERADLLALEPTEVEPWLLALNDIRLALAERLEIDGVEDPDRGAAGEVYDWLGWLQSGLIDTIDA